MSVTWSVWIGFTALTALAAGVDARRHIIPNVLAVVAGIGGLMLLSTGVLPWTRLLWAAGTWALYEVLLWRQPGSLGWGDVKWGSLAMLYCGGAGLLVLAAGHAGCYLWGTVRWLGQRRREPWYTYGGPWAPGALAGLLIMGMTMVAWH